MESCHSVSSPVIKKVPHPPSGRRLPSKIHSTLEQLIDVLKQLHSKEELSSVLQDLAEVGDGQSLPTGVSSTGHSAPTGSGTYIDLDPGTIIKVAQILRKLNTTTMQTARESHGTNFASSTNLACVSEETPGTIKVGGERVQKATTEGRNLSLSKQDSLYLMKKIRDFEQKCKPLQEKNKKFLERNMELTTANRSLKEQIRNIADENKKMKESYDQIKKKYSVLSRQLSQEKQDKENLEEKALDVDRLQTQVTEQAKTISNMKQQAAEKDRRMEVLQHRKKRRLRMSAEYISRLSSPCSVDDDRSQDSDVSFSSNTSVMSEDDLTDELPQDDVEHVEKVEKNYKRLMKEHLTLQKSSAKLQGILGWGTDQQRYVKSKMDFETDLFVAQCKIEQLEECLEKYKEMDGSWAVEKEQMDQEKEKMTKDINKRTHKIEELKSKLRETTDAYEELKEQSEHLEFLVLESQENNSKAEVITQDAATCTEEQDWPNNGDKSKDVDVDSYAVEELIVAEHVDTLDMAESEQDVYRTMIRGLEDKLVRLLKQGTDVATVTLQLKQAEQNIIDVIEVETNVEDLQSRVASLESANNQLQQKLSKCRVKIDSQEQSLFLTKDEREELMQVKPKTPPSLLNNRLRLAEMGQTSVRERDSESLTSPRFPAGDAPTLLKPALSNESGEKSLSGGGVSTESEKRFDSHVIATTSPDREFYDQPRRFRINSLPVINTNHDMFSEVDKLQRQIQELQEENDVLKFELTHKGHGDSDGSSSDSEDSRLVELRETCENLRERLQSAETTEKQCKDRLKLAEKHIMELELSESVLRDRVEEGNADCDKLRKQIVRLQRKIRELKDLNCDKETNEQILMDKLKYLEEAEALLSQKVTELEGTNHILKQRLDVKEELLADVHLVQTLQDQVDKLQADNNTLESKVIDLEENNEVLRDNWKKVADEEANRRECLEEKIRVLECANSDLKAKLKDQETDLDLSSGPSIASEINEDTIEQLNERIRELESEIGKLKDDKDQKIESLEETVQNMKEIEAKLNESLDEMKNNETELHEKIAELEKISGEASSEHDGRESELKDQMHELEKSYEKKLTLMKREIAEYQQQEDDLCARIEELEDTEVKLNDKISKFKETEMNYKNKIEEMENRETSLTIRFSQRVEEFEQKEKLTAEEHSIKIEELENKNKELEAKVSFLEKHEKESSEKAINNNNSEFIEQESIALLQCELSPQATSVSVQEKYESVAQLERQASVSSVGSGSQNNTDDIEALRAENLKLQEEIAKLKKQEKKRKRSERADNTDDYDTIAREVVTYKMEVEQLRSENTDLHERIMELDESEKSLQETNEKLKEELAALEKVKDSIELSNEREQQLVNRINELESVEQNLNEQIVELKTSKTETDEFQTENTAETGDDLQADNEVKQTTAEMVDKNIGTEDFMEGVMPGQEQGKPVSSMFERIQILENENQELSTKLSTLTTTDAQVRQLSDKVKALEENEDSLMERVMELEDEEDRLRRELNRIRNSATSTSDLEDEVATLQGKESELNSTIEGLKSEYDSLKKTMESSDSEKGDIAVRLASVQKQYEAEKKKVESLLQGEEKWMKSVASEKKATKEMEEELANTQEKLEELQTEYESKLSEKDESEKVLKDEINKMARDKEMMRKKLQEFEKSNSELEDEIEHCKISESRMFHRLQLLISQNEELELKQSKLIKLIPHMKNDSVTESDKVQKSESSHLMSENPEVVSENPLNTSIFTESELDLLRSKTPDYDLLGSVPLDMLRKMKDFDQREQNYQTKVEELEAKNAKLNRTIKVFHSKEKDLKHEIKELQLVLIKHQSSSKKLLASTSSLELDRSGSEDGVDSDNQSEGPEDHETIKLDSKDIIEDTDYDNMTEEDLLLTVKLFNEKQIQDQNKIKELEDEMNKATGFLEKIAKVVTSENLETFLETSKALTADMEKQDFSADFLKSLTRVLEAVTGVKNNLEALQTSEQNLRLQIADNELATEKLEEESRIKVEQLEAQIHVLAKMSKLQSQSSDENKADNRSKLTPSKTINIDVAPTEVQHARVTDLSSLGQSETIRVSLPPSKVVGESDEDCSDAGYYGYSDSASTMMDKAEDVLRQRIKDLEKLEKHLKQQVTDLESDREELHEIARKDKNIIHEQNVLIRELHLSQRNLSEQVKSFEISENNLYGRLDKLEAEMDNKDDRIRHLEILEGRLKDLVKQYKLDEKILVTQSETLQSNMKEMSEKEETLKQKVQNLESEKSAFSERSEYLQLRLKELENAEFDLAERTKNQEDIMQTLQNTVIELENFGANAHARVLELEHMNFDLQERLHHSMTENSPMMEKTMKLQQQCDQMLRELSALRDLEMKLRQENETLEKQEITLQQQVKVHRMKEVELEARVRDLEEGDNIMKDKLSKLQRSENTLKYRVQELESSGIQAPSDLTSNLQSGMTKLPRTLEDCQRRIIVLQANNAELQSRLQNWNDVSGTNPKVSHGMVPVPEAEYQNFQRKVAVLQQTEQQLAEADRLNTHLNKIIVQLREGKDVCGHEMEIEVLRKRLDVANMSLKTLQNPATGQWDIKGPNVQLSMNGSLQSPGGEDEVIEETMLKTSADSVQIERPPGQKLSRDSIIDDLMRSLCTSPAPCQDEDKHWQEIESRMEATNRGGGEEWIRVGKATSMSCTDRGDNRSHGKEEELELGVALYSETDTHYLQNDTDSNRFGNRLPSEQYSPTMRNSRTPTLPAAQRKIEKTTDGFVNSIIVQDNYGEVSDQPKEMSYRRLSQGGHGHGGMSAPSIIDSIVDSGRGTASLSITTSAMTLRERIAHIERQLSPRESDSAREFSREMDLASWNARVLESNRKLELAEKDNKHYKDEINKLEKDLEEKTRLYHHLETFLKAVQTILADKSTASDKEMVNRVEEEVKKVVSNISDSSCHDNTSDAVALSNQLAKKDRELTAKCNEVDALMQELRTWQQECRTIEDMRANALDSLRSLEIEVNELQLADKQLKEVKDSYNMLKGQAGETEESKDRVTAATQRTRIIQLTKLCKEKDVLIKKLVQELKKLKSGARSSPLVEEICRLDTDFNQNRLGRSSSQSSLDSMDRMSIVSDTELLRENNSSISHRPRSADVHARNTPHRASYHGHSSLPHHSLPRHRGAPRHVSRTSSTPHAPRPPRSGKHNGWAGDTGYRATQYVAVAEYDPSMFSQSGHPRLELPLSEGDMVLVTGPLLDSGYVEGEVNGKIGLVPLSYLQLVSPRRGAGNHRVPEHLNASPERIAQLYNSLHNVHTPNTHGFHNGIPSGNTELPGNRRYVTMATCPPDAPEDFHVEKIIGSSSLMLAWKPVHVDSTGCNNGVKVTGYKVYRNNKLVVQPRGRHAAKAIIEHINIQSHLRFGIQTVAADGSVSELSEIMYEGVEEVTTDENSDTESEMDMATLLNVEEYKSGQKRTFMGVYDYDPSKNSPYEHPTCELAFKAGDIMTVYGRQRGDGFYYAELNGVRGLIPTFFIEEMPQPPPRTKKIAARNKQSLKEKNTEKQDQ